MNERVRTKLVPAWLFAAAFCAAAQAGEFSLSLASGSQLWLEGDSSLHPYSSTATVVHLRAVLESSSGTTTQSLAQTLSRARVRTFETEIPVVGLKSHSAGLDKNLHKTLRAKEFPVITFQLKNDHLLRL